jgi:hypothetical protein
MGHRLAGIAAALPLAAAGIGAKHTGFYQIMPFLQTNLKL